MIRSADDDIYPGPRRILDNDRVAVLSGGSGARQLQIVKLPWPKIDAALKALSSDVPAHVKPGQTVTLQIEVGAVRSGTPEQAKVELLKTVTERLEADGIKVADGQPVVISLRYSEEAGATLNEVAGGGPGAPPGPGPGPFGGVATGKTVQGTKAFCDVAYKIAGSNTPFWFNRIDLDPRHIIVRGEASAAKAREATFGMLKSQLIQQPIPYFVPKDSTLATLPGVTQLAAASATAPARTSKATPKPTRRGEQ
jgi:hypothetical protein